MVEINEPVIKGRITTLSNQQDEAYIKTMILSVLKEQKVSLSQTRGIFESIINQIEDENPIVL